LDIFQSLFGVRIINSLFCALRAYCIYIIGVKNLVVEVNAKYLKGMLNNPDIQPNATINR
jgi:hypothetical protein